MDLIGPKVTLDDDATKELLENVSKSYSITRKREAINDVLEKSNANGKHNIFKSFSNTTKVGIMTKRANKRQKLLVKPANNLSPNLLQNLICTSTNQTPEYSIENDN